MDLLISREVRATHLAQMDANPAYGIGGAASVTDLFRAYIHTCNDLESRLAAQTQLVESSAKVIKELSEDRDRLAGVVERLMAAAKYMLSEQCGGDFEPNGVPALKVAVAAADSALAGGAR